MNKENLDIRRFEGSNIKKIYPCGGHRVGVPYARDFYVAHPDVLSAGKTRDVMGTAAEKIAENVKKFDKETSALTRAFMAMKKSFSK